MPYILLIFLQCLHLPIFYGFHLLDFEWQLGIYLRFEKCVQQSCKDHPERHLSSRACFTFAPHFVHCSNHS